MTKTQETKNNNQQAHSGCGCSSNQKKEANVCSTSKVEVKKEPKRSSCCSHEDE